MDDDIFFSRARPIIRPTLLYGLLPRNIGTGDVESVSSYISSLAHAHRITTTQLVNVVLPPLFAKYTNTGPHNIWPEGSTRLSGTSKNSEILVNVLVDATGQSSVINSTLLPIKHLVSHTNLIASKQRVCLECLKEDINSSGLPYGRLLWQVALVPCCPIHRVRLIEPVCTMPKTPSANRFNVSLLFGVCRRCGRLGHACSAANVTKATNSEVMRANQCRVLIAALPSMQQINPFDIKQAFILYYRERGGYSKIARSACVGKSEICTWLNVKSQRLSLRSFFDIANVIGIEVLDLLQGRFDGFSESLIAPVHRTKRIMSTLIESNATAAMLAAIESGRSVTSVASELGVDRKTLRAKSPQIFQQLVEKSLREEQDKREQQYAESVATASDIIYQLLQKGMAPTLMNAAYLTKDDWFPAQMRSLALMLLRRELGDQQISIPVGKRFPKAIYQLIQATALLLKKRLGIKSGDVAIFENSNNDDM